jgi:hypothetical protein
MARSEIRGGQIKDDSITGEDVDESTLVLDTLRDADGDTKIQIEESADEDKIRFDTAGVERMIITNAGAVGIGTSSPDNTLHVESPGTTHVKIVSEAGYEAALKLKSGTESSAYVWQPGNTSDLRFYVNGADRMHIDNNGKIGIGTTDPGELLTINAAQDGSECFIKFEEAGADRAKVGINTSNNLVLHNQFTNKHIVMKVNDNGVTREGFRLNGAVPEVVVNESSDSLVNFRVESDSNTHMLFVTGSGKVGINDSTPTSTLTVQGSLALSVLNINAANDPGSTYTIAATNCVILVNTRPTAEGGIDSAMTLTLPDASDNPGMITTVKDAAGYSNVNRIFVVPAGSDKIDGVIDSFQIPTIGGWVKLISDGISSWAQIGG